MGFFSSVRKFFTGVTEERPEAGPAPAAAAEAGAPEASAGEPAAPAGPEGGEVAPEPENRPEEVREENASGSMPGPEAASAPAGQGGDGAGTGKPAASGVRNGGGAATESEEQPAEDAGPAGSGMMLDGTDLEEENASDAAAVPEAAAASAEQGGAGVPDSGEPSASAGRDAAGGASEGNLLQGRAPAEDGEAGSSPDAADAQAMGGFFARIRSMLGGKPAEGGSATVQEAAGEPGAPSPAGPEASAAADASSGRESAEEASPRFSASLSSTAVPVREKPSASADAAMTLALRRAEPKLSAWLEVVLDGVEDAGPLLWERLAFLLRALEAPQNEADAFLKDFRGWLDRMEYRRLDDFRSELQYRLALALDMEDEEDERDRLFAKLQDGLARTRARLGQGLAALVAGHSDLGRPFWDEMEELFIMSDMGAETAMSLVSRLRARAAAEGVTTPEGVLPLLEQEVEAAFKAPRRIAAVNPPEVVLMVGVNGVGKTTTIAKLAFRAKSEGRRVLIAAADTFRAAAVEQLEVWADRLGVAFHSKGMGADPAAVAFEAMDMALKGGYDLVFIDTAGRLHTKSNLMDELHKIRMVVERKHPGAPHRTVLVIDATTGQNALQQTKMFRESSGVNEIILTKLDGTAKGGVALAVASQFDLPITFIGLGEKMEDLRPFDPHGFARALVGRD